MNIDMRQLHVKGCGVSCIHKEERRKTNMKQFESLYTKHKDNLELYVPVVARVHGPTHPVFYDVQTQYNSIVEKVNEDVNNDLSVEFKTLNALTDNFAIPADTCETYEAVYNMLQELDSAYQSQ